ncbi:MAG: aspartate dehydrogenase [Chloroflexi bacterium]|nr:aspartate dehydrogenase [Chloroflexota bacterium]
MSAVIKKIGIAGCGTIGQKVATELDLGKVPGATLAAMTSRSMDKARAFVATLANPVPVLALEEMAQLVDLVVEAAIGSALNDIAIATLKAGKDLMALSGGALLGRQDLFDLAWDNGATIYVPSGAIAGLDGVVSASAGRIDSVTMTTRKPPGGLKGAPGVANIDFDLDTLQEPRIVYEGPTAEACRLFPANVNVSAALSMAGIGPDRTTIRIYADPTVTRNTHEIVVEGEFGRLAIKIENTPSSTNPRTGVLSALSAIASLKKITSPLQIGT